MPGGVLHPTIKECRWIVRNETNGSLGWATGLLVHMGESYLFDNAKLYAKWMDDIEQSQTAEGAIPDVAPAFWNYYSG